MALQKLQFRPGIDRENTNYTNEGGWYSMDKVRFRSGTPQKIGGWVLNNNYSTTNYSYFYQGVARNLINWSSLTSENLIGVGTHVRYYIQYGSLYYNITPVRDTATLTNPFATVSGSTLITVTDASHGALPGDFVIYSGAGVTAVGGIGTSVIKQVQGFKINTVIDTNTYTIISPTAATSTATGGGTVTATYEVPAGLPAYTLGNGWGAGIWNGISTVPGISTTLAYTSGTAVHELLNASSTSINVASTTGFSTSGTILIDAEVITYSGKTGTSFTGCTRGTNGSTAAVHAQRQTAPGTYAAIPVYQVSSLVGTTGWGQASATYGVGQQLRLWSSDNFGQDLLIAPRGGAIYYWTKNTSSFPVAVLVSSKVGASNVPTNTNEIVVSDVSRFVIAMGANGYGSATFDPMLVRWSDQENYLDWTPTAINQAGELRLSNGSYIMTSAKMKQEILIWTDTALYSMQYIGPPYAWGINPLMTNLSIISPNAVATVNNTAFWMGVDKFYMYNGRVETLPCSLRQYIFDDISVNQKFQTFAGTNEGFNEIWWFYVSNTEENAAQSQGRVPLPDRYVIYNHLERIWYYGNLYRTAWNDSPLQLGPLAAYGDVNTGRLLVHEQGNDDITTDVTTPILAYIQSADFDIGDGQQFMFVWRMLPDVSFVGSNAANPQATITLYPRQNSGANYGTGVGAPVISISKDYAVQQFTQQLNTRVRGRQMALKISSADLGVQWQGGSIRIDSRTDGQKS